MSNLKNENLEFVIRQLEQYKIISSDLIQKYLNFFDQSIILLLLNNRILESPVRIILKRKNGKMRFCYIENSVEVYNEK